MNFILRINSDYSFEKNVFNSSAAVVIFATIYLLALRRCSCRVERLLQKKKKKKICFERVTQQQSKDLLTKAK